PKIVPKRQLIITDELEGTILSMYAMGVSTRAMGDYVQEMYAIEISPAEISRITYSVLPAVQE
ncbi:IS256 family transposase, partial [Elizabethkingia argentiflava]|nr:IS256 family transposase [Elizabethkingia argenteiflava]